MLDSGRPFLCLIDEIDSKLEQSWPYEALLPIVETKGGNKFGRVFILAGSTGQRIEDMEKIILSRPKGRDPMSRIPSNNKYSLPAMSPEDRMIVAALQIRRIGLETGRDVRYVEKLALYYMALNPKLDSARQVREFVARCLERIPLKDERVKYDHLFEPGDARNKEFWLLAKSQAPQLMGRFVAIED